MTWCDTAFDLLDRWRHLPSYQLERRADIFFAVYLPKFLNQHLRTAVDPRIVPEFPLRTREGDYKSCKADYLALAADRSRVFFIELKTDCGSRRDDQDRYLLAAQQKGLPALLLDVRDIAARSTAKRKYAHLLLALAELGLLEVPSTMRGRLQQPVPRGLSADIAATRVNIEACPIDLYCLQPRTAEEVPGISVITFETFGAWLLQQPDPLAQRFARSLQRWCVDAGRSNE